MEVIGARHEDIRQLEWFYENFNEKNIPNMLTYRMGLCNFILSSEKINQMDNYLKAIRQDFKKIFTAIQNIDLIYLTYENRESENLSDNDRENVAIYIEYAITKYRVIIEYTLKIIDMLIEYTGTNIKTNGKKFSTFEIYNMKLDYLKSLISDERCKILNDRWFQSIRKTRNSIIHNGATCLVFGNSGEKMFQIYDLEVEELVRDEFYLHEGNCIYFEYFMTLNISYLVYFIDSVFSIILSKGGYSENNNFIYESIFNNALSIVGDKQKCVMKWVKNIIDSYNKAIL
ncbi:MAG: hypothetical protein IKW30_04420 [Lachnospiraceae bacterium]|nr:hypothetical protein [Lachnospiraceae bacterium]